MTKVTVSLCADGGRFCEYLRNVPHQQGDVSTTSERRVYSQSHISAVQRRHQEPLSWLVTSLYAENHINVAHVRLVLQYTKDIT